MLKRSKSKETSGGGGGMGSQTQRINPVSAIGTESNNEAAAAANG